MTAERRARTHEPEPREGTQLAGRYRLREQLSRTERAVVWEATDVKLARPVIVKLGAAALVGQPLEFARFARTARSAGAVRNRNVARVLDHSASGPLPYLVLEPAGTHTLADSTRNRSPRAEEIEGLFLTLRSAVDCLHRHGVPHGAIDSENVLLGDGNDVILTSFGFARTGGSSESSRSSESISFEDDLRALGATMLALAGATKLAPDTRRQLEDLAATATPAVTPAPAATPASAVTPAPAGPEATRPQKSAVQSSRHQRAVDAASWRCRRLAPDRCRRLVPGRCRRLVPGIAVAAAAAAGITLATTGTATSSGTAQHQPPAGRPAPPAVTVRLPPHPSLEQRLSSLSNAVQQAASR